MASERTLLISNGGTYAELNTENGQLFSLMRGRVEVMWPGGAPAERRPAAGWQNSEIVMFPIVGAAPEDRFLVGSLGSFMNQHGLSRYMEWKDISSRSDRIEMKQVYRAGDVVKGKTPCSFAGSYTLAKSYSLDGEGKLSFTLEIKNDSDMDFRFAAGWHPAFRSVNNATFAVGRGPVMGLSKPLEDVRNAAGNVLRFDGASDVIYRTSGFSVVMMHTFGKTQIWDKGEGLVAIEPITSPSLSGRQLGGTPIDINAQEDYRWLRRGAPVELQATVSVYPEETTDET